MGQNVSNQWQQVVPQDNMNASIGNVHPSESDTIAAFRGESQLDENGNVFNTFNMQDRYSFLFSSIITLIDPNQIGGSRGDISAARFELVINPSVTMLGTLLKKCCSVYFELQFSSLPLSAVYVIFFNQRNLEYYTPILNKTYHSISRFLWRGGQELCIPIVFRCEGTRLKFQQNHSNSGNFLEIPSLPKNTSAQ